MTDAWTKYVVPAPLRAKQMEEEKRLDLHPRGGHPFIGNSAPPSSAHLPGSSVWRDPGHKCGRAVPSAAAAGGEVLVGTGTAQ